jgi:uncharacterized protein (TIGR02246 family)
MEALVATATTNEHLLKLERQYWEAIRDKDAAAALRLTDDQVVVTGSQGVGLIDHNAFRQMLGADAWTLHEFTLHDEQVRMVSDDVAVVAYKVTEKMTVEGKPLTLEAADASTWVRRDGRWLCVLHTESILGDPFGRDRQRMSS